MNILITGGAGFIGSNLCIFLVSEGHNVVVVDNLSTGNINNLEQIIDDITFYQERIENFDFEKCNNLDAIIHLAAQASVPESISNFKESSTINLLSSINVIDHCNSNQIPLVYASSSAIYGELDFGNDDEQKVGLTSPYATDKYTMELYARTSRKLYNLSSIGLRFFNVYGPRQDPTSSYSGVISIFVGQILNNKPININGGEQTRDFIYVEDVVKLINKSLMISVNKVVCEQVNALTGNSISINMLADILMRQLDCNVERRYHKKLIGDPEKSEGSVNKMLNFFDMKLSELTQLDAGLKNTINFIKTCNFK